MPVAETAVVISAAILVPHLLPLHRVAAPTAAAIWLSVLALRALVAIGGALFLFVHFPQTGLYTTVTDWCWHDAMPFLFGDDGLSAHPLVHVAVALPTVVLAGSVLWLVLVLARAWLALRQRLGRAIGQGPLGSTVIDDEEVIVGVARVGRGHILVSQTALDALDAGELRASLSHELGHIHRRHRPLLLLASALAALGRAIPGTASAGANLRLSLERDADDYAVRRTRDPLALASAICKAATERVPAGTTGLSGSAVGLRLDYLEGQIPRAGRALEGGVRLVAASLILATLALSATLYGWALSVPDVEHALLSWGGSCPHHGHT